jgi:hypothetical protein
MCFLRTAECSSSHARFFNYEAAFVIPSFNRPPARSLRLGERADPTLVNWRDTQDRLYIRPSQDSRHDRLGMERLKDRVIDEVSEEIRGGLVAAFFEGDSGLFVIFFPERDVDGGKDFSDRAFAAGGWEFLIRHLLEFHELDRRLHDDMGIDRMQAGIGGAEQLEGFVVTLLTAQE